MNILCLRLCMKRSIVCEGLYELFVRMALKPVLSGVNSLFFSQEVWDSGKKSHGGKEGSDVLLSIV